LTEWNFIFLRCLWCPLVSRLYCNG